MARQKRVTVACEVPVRRPSSAAEQWVTAAGSSRMSSPTLRRDPASRGSSVRISVVTSVEGMRRRYQPPFGGQIEYQDHEGERCSCIGPLHCSLHDPCDLLIHLWSRMGWFNPPVGSGVCPSSL